MSRRRKHVTEGLERDIGPPSSGQAIVRALGSRGSNIVEVEYPDGHTTLVLMPAKFNKKLWVKRGGYLLIEDSEEAQGDTKVTGTILTVLYNDHIKQLQKLPGAWPAEFAENAKGELGDMMPPGSDSDSEEEDGEGHELHEQGDAGEERLPPLQANTNRKVVYHEVSDDSDDEEDD